MCPAGCARPHGQQSYEERRGEDHARPSTSPCPLCTTTLRAAQPLALAPKGRNLRTVGCSMTNPLNRRRMPTLPTMPPSVMLEPARVTRPCSHAQARRSPRDLRLSANLGQFRDLDLVARYERDRRVCDTRRDKPDAMNTPTVALFASTVPRFGFGPRASKHKVVEPTPELACRPCGVHGRKRCPEGHFRCGWELSVEDVNQAIQEVCAGDEV